MSTVSKRRRNEVVAALRNGTVPHSGLDVLAVGLDKFERSIHEELNTVAGGGAIFKAVRGEYGAGKTFFSRWLAEQAKIKGMAVAEVQISETETPLHKLETVYRRVCEAIQTSSFPPSAFRLILDAWLFTLETDADADPDSLLESRLSEVSKSTPAFATALRAYRQAVEEDDVTTAEGLAAWLAGQPNVSGQIRRRAGIKGDLDHFGALGFLQGLLTVLRDSGHPGLLLVLDEVETLQRVRTDVREKALNALRQLIDEVDSGRFPGLFLLITGTPAFFDGAQGVQRLPPLAQRLATDFSMDPKFDNPRAIQLRLSGFNLDRLCELGRNVRDLYAAGAEHPERIADKVDDTYIHDFAASVVGGLGGNVGIAPRLFLKKLVDVPLDRTDQFEDFDPRRDYKLVVDTREMSEEERNSALPASPADIDDIDLS